MKAIVFAYHNIGCVGIRTLLAHGIEICAIFTHEDKPGEAIWFDSVAELAAAHDIPVFAPEDINHPLWLERIETMQPDILFSFYYRTIIRKKLRAIPPRGCLNLHGSLLPAYRGRCPVNWVLVNGETETGVTLHHMVAKADAGDIVAQRAVAVDDDDTALSLHGKMAAAAGALLDGSLPAIMAGTAAATPQNDADATSYGGRKPADGIINWQRDAASIRNLVRAVTRPYPGAFSWLGNQKCLFWQVSVVPGETGVQPGTVLSLNPLRVQCGKDALTVDFAQTEDGLYVSGRQLARDLNLVTGMKFQAKLNEIKATKRRKHVLILGVNGFIGNHLSERLLQSDRYEVHGMDLVSDCVDHLRANPRFHFTEGDISIMHEWIEYHVRKCDIILPLVAIATPIEYVRNPLKVFELDFEENLRIVRYCVKYGKRLIFPSTSEVYGMCNDKEFDESNSRLILGPINKQRWIYSCCKQMLDRVIWAYGASGQLDFTLFRPFNWVGPKLDSLESARIGSSRVITQFILNLVEGTPIRLVDGGAQKRCFTDVKDGVECLFRIIEDRHNNCNGQIFNVGNPDNEYSMAELAYLLREAFRGHPLRAHFPAEAGIQTIEARAFYGEGYQDVQHRRPSIRPAQKNLDWQPSVAFETSVAETLDYFLRTTVASDQPQPVRRPKPAPTQQVAGVVRDRILL